MYLDGLDEEMGQTQGASAGASQSSQPLTGELVTLSGLGMKVRKVAVG